MFEYFYANWDKYMDKLLLRSQQVANSPEIIRRLGVVAMNTPLEVDIYAHANSTNALGSRMLNGLGGSADFLRNAKLSIMHTPSARPSKTDRTFSLSLSGILRAELTQYSTNSDRYLVHRPLRDPHRPD
jgi:acetyl-CoA hydrolase